MVVIQIGMWWINKNKELTVLRVSKTSKKSRKSNKSEIMIIRMRTRMTLKKCFRSPRWRILRYPQPLERLKRITTSLLKSSKTMNQWISTRSSLKPKRRWARSKGWCHSRCRSTATWPVRMMRMTTMARMRKIRRGKGYYKKNSSFIEKNTGMLRQSWEARPMRRSRTNRRIVTLRVAGARTRRQVKL